MSRRDDKGQFIKRPSVPVFIGSWACSLGSIGLVYLSATMVVANFGSMRSCSANDTTLVLKSCGKQSINLGDLLLIGVFLLSACLTLSLSTHAWRLTKRVFA